MANALAANLMFTKTTVFQMSQQMDIVNMQLHLLREEMAAMQLQQNLATAAILAGQAGYFLNKPRTHPFVMLLIFSRQERCQLLQRYA
jgi:hypothetical protein